MAQEILNLQDESFEKIIQVLRQGSSAIIEHYDRAVDRLSALSSEWDDEDYQNLLLSLKNIESKINEIDDKTMQMVSKAEYKVEMIRARTQIKFE